MVLYQENLVSDQMTGTCQRKDGKPTLRLSDNATDYFESVEVKVVLTEAADAAVYQRLAGVVANGEAQGFRGIIFRKIVGWQGRAGAAGHARAGVGQKAQGDNHQ